MEKGLRGGGMQPVGYEGCGRGSGGWCEAVGLVAEVVYMVGRSREERVKGTYQMGFFGGWRCGVLDPEESVGEVEGLVVGVYQKHHCRGSV